MTSGTKNRKQQQGEINKTTRADKRGKTRREQNNGTRRGDTKPRDTFLASRIYMRAKPSPGHVRKVRQAVSLRPMPFMRIGV